MAELLKTDFEGRTMPLLRLSLWTAILTVLTLGFYRFWMKTRLRRYFWSSVRPDQTPLEYVGKGIEKFTGFLIALVVLALLIGVVALLLVYASFALFQEDFEAYVIAAILAVPLVYFAAYRAKRYVYARTRWRGIRFGLEPAAGAYALRACGHLLLAVVTLGVLWPRMTFKLEKFRTDRTFFGESLLHQGGKWTMLLPPFLPVLICLWVTVICFSLGLQMVELLESGTERYDAKYIAVLMLSGSAGTLLFFVFYLRYRVIAFRKMVSHKTAGEIGLISTASYWRIFWITVGGYMLTNLMTGLLTFVVVVPAGFIVARYVVPDDLGTLPFGGDPAASLLGPELAAIFAIVAYLLGMLLFSVFRQTFVLFPTWRHYASTLHITGGEHLAEVRQRARDEAAQAEGMAEAFDLGAAI